MGGVLRVRSFPTTARAAPQRQRQHLVLERTALLRHLLAPGARLLARGTGAWVLRSAAQARHFTWCLEQQLLVFLGLRCASPGAGAW